MFETVEVRLEPLAVISVKGIAVYIAMVFGSTVVDARLSIK